MPPEPANRNPQSDELEAAIDALLEEIDTTCTRYENPVTPGQDEPTAGDAAPDDPAGSETRNERPDEPTPAADAEAAIDQAAASADELLEQAADDLLDALGSEVEQARPESPEPTPTPDEPTPASNDELLEDALDDLLGASADDAAPEPSDEVPESTTAPEADASDSDQALPEEPPAEATEEPSEARGAADHAADAMSSLDEAFDDLLDGTFEAADGTEVSTEGVDVQPDPSLMLDQSAPEPVAPPKSAPVTKPEPAAESPAPAPQPVVAPAPVAKPADAPARDAGQDAGLLERIRVRIGPPARAACDAALKVARPAGARLLVLLSKPLEGKSPRVRDSIGWMAIWTLFLALCVWAYLAVRTPPPGTPDPDASRVITPEPTTPG